MARWPNVPAVYGWLSLSESGQWRLHPQGDALQHPDSRGEDITSPQILAFMNRNYGVDDQGRWFFQNGPQRVYVRLDAAPYVAHTTSSSDTDAMKLRTHTGLDVRGVSRLFLDQAGRLYAATELGCVLIAGRDLPALLELLKPANAESSDGIHEALEQCLDSGSSVQVWGAGIQGFPQEPIILQPCSGVEIEGLLGFQRLPQPPEGKGGAA